ncbi:MAG: hypothetical protein CMK89_22680 [Pseudomonadales bacterium]|nr:hypothetical protein [Pseudomonadales bacterium]
MIPLTEQLYAFHIVITLNIATLRQSDTVYLLDSSIYIFQAWFGYPDYFHDGSGRSVNAVYGYAKTLLSQLRRLNPAYILAAFDESLFSGFRHELYPDYKANRALPDEELAHQLHLCRRFTDLLGIQCVGDSVYEADDWLALGAEVAAAGGLRTTVVTRDKDLAQLVRPGDLWWDWREDLQRDHRALQEHWKVLPERIPDLLALMGDSSDNIPGIAGIGEKSAKMLLGHFGDLENLYANLEAVLALEVRGARRLYNALQNTEEEAFLFRELIRLHPPPEHLTLQDMRFNPVPPAAILEFLEQEGLGTAFRNLVTQHYA